MTDHFFVVSTRTRRYASCLFEVSQTEKGAHDRILSALRCFLDFLEETPQFYRYLTNPVVPLAQKDEKLLHLFSGATFPPLCIHFFRLLVQQKALPLLREILFIYRKLMDAEQGVLRGVLFLAHTPSSLHFMQKLTHLLEESLGCKIHLDMCLDSSLMGGLMLRFENHLLDASVRTCLRSLSLTLKEAA